MTDPFRHSDSYNVAAQGNARPGKSLPQLLLSVLRRRIRGARRKFAVRLRRGLLAQLEGRPKVPEPKVPDHPVRMDRRV
ncbi:hypothetical protein [Puniceibacterium sediminis]|uniref:Uncharacterized protein n=1 Tax=Puniceibacterium sediminis TaxID=1608407 RepID=A0A238VU40_9RHOB|nr:hypothetical protein [Puniceibacterium sediminis]SNR37835.1 hypothetical protein SAMN06265370_103168 [Puniceibacterium sediminis]